MFYVRIQEPEKHQNVAMEDLMLSIQIVCQLRFLMMIIFTRFTKEDA